jgi:hypothetical protein
MFAILSPRIAPPGDLMVVGEFVPDPAIGLRD